MNTTDKPIYAWHFSDGYLRFDMSDIEVKAGLVLETDAKPVVAEKGFHACRGAHDALFNQSSNPRRPLVISRVKLSGKMVTGNFGYEVIAAQRREHLWVADAEKAVEEFALGYMEQVLRKLEKAGCAFSDTLYWAIENRRLLFAQGLPQDKLDELAEYVKLTKQHPTKVYFRQPSIHQRNSPEFWFDAFAPTSLEGLADYIHDKLAHVIRYKTSYLASDGVESFAKLIQVLIETTATQAYREQEREAILKHISDRQGLVALPTIPPTPEKYIEQMRVQYAIPSLNPYLHNILLQLAPEAYTEP